MRDKNRSRRQRINNLKNGKLSTIIIECQDQPSSHIISLRKSARRDILIENQVNRTPKGDMSVRSSLKLNIK